MSDILGGETIADLGRWYFSWDPLQIGVQHRSFYNMHGYTGLREDYVSINFDFKSTAKFEQMQDTEGSCSILKVRSLQTFQYSLTFPVDDMFLTSPIYSGGTFRVEPADLAPHITWMAAVNAKLPAGSNWTMEIGHNGNGNIGVCYCYLVFTSPIPKFGQMPFVG